MKTYSFGTHSLCKAALIAFGAGTAISFLVLAALSFWQQGSLTPQTAELAGLSAGLGLGQSVLICVVLYLQFLRPLQRLEHDLAALAINPELILPADDHTGSYNADIQHLRQHINSLSKAVRHTIRQRQRLADVGEAVVKINHDLRNMLASAMLVIDQLENSTDPRVSEAAPVVIRATEQASLLCQNMLDYVTDLPQPDPQPVLLADLAEDIQKSNEIEVKWQGAERLFIDQIMFHRLLLNLARNAAQAGATCLTIDIWKARNLAVIDISDNGPGISDDMRQTLFRAFASGQPTGYGLGLAICLDMALALGGRLKLSRSTADGSEFRLQLPAACLSVQD